MAEEIEEFTAPTRRKPVHREAILQRYIKRFARDNIMCSHEFFAFDRSARDGFSHVREKAKGLRKATPDTLVITAAFRDFWCELKWGNNKPDDDQLEMGRRLKDLGCHWYWTTSVVGYYGCLREVGIPMRNYSAEMAEAADRSVAAMIAKAEAKLPSKAAPRKRAPRYTMTVAKGVKFQRRGLL